MIANIRCTYSRRRRKLLASFLLLDNATQPTRASGNLIASIIARVTGDDKRRRRRDRAARRRCAVAAAACNSRNSHWLAAALRVLHCAAHCVAVAWRRGSPYRARLVFALECSWEPDIGPAVQQLWASPAVVPLAWRVCFTRTHTLHFACKREKERV